MKDAQRTLQECSKDASSIQLEYFEVISKMIQKYFKNILRVLLIFFKHVSRFLKDDPKIFKGALHVFIKDGSKENRRIAKYIYHGQSSFFCSFLPGYNQSLFFSQLRLKLVGQPAPRKISEQEPSSFPS